MLRARARTLPFLLAIGGFGQTAHAQTYVWEAAGVVTDNDGITAVPNGSPFTYRFSYDIAAVNTATSSWFGRYVGPEFAARIVVNGYEFNALQDDFVGLEVGQFSQGSSSNETLAFSAGHVSVPPGWSTPSHQNEVFQLVLQNSPAQGVITSLAPPMDIQLSPWIHTRSLRMDFHNGVTFPGGTLATRTTLTGSITSITLVPAPSAMVLFPLAIALTTRSRPIARRR